MVCLSEIIILCLGPIENKKKVLKIVGFIVSAAINTVGILLVKTHFGSMIIFTCLMIAVLMIAAIIKEKRGET